MSFELAIVESNTLKFNLEIYGENKKNQVCNRNSL